MDSMRVTVPEGRSGTVEIRKMVSEKPSLRDQIRDDGRNIPEGYDFTALYRNGQIWMSDTPAEQRDHYPAIKAALDFQVQSALVNGLGLGMVVQALLLDTNVHHIDVVEIDDDVIRLVGQHYRDIAASIGKSVIIHHADAYTITWPWNTRWDIAWSDIWQHASTDNLPEMAKLGRKYGKRTKWHGMWLREELRAERRSERAYKRRVNWMDNCWQSGSISI